MSVRAHTHTHGWLRPPFKSPVRNNNTYFIRPAEVPPATFNSLTQVEMSAGMETMRLLEVLTSHLLISGFKWSKNEQNVIMLQKREVPHYSAGPVTL